MKRIPKALRQAIKTKLKTETRPLNSAQIADAVNSTVKSTYRKTARQMAFVLKQMTRDGDLLIAETTKNGYTSSGNERVRQTYVLNHEVEDPDIIGENE